jgi:C1A family cysteine protease
MANLYGYQRDPITRPEPNGSVTNLIQKDLKFRDIAAKLGATKTTGDVDLSPYCVDMNQHALSSCVGNATVESLEILNNIAGYKPVPLSRLFVYNMARIRNGNLDKDAGTFIRTAFDVLSRFGVCDEYLWPYDEKLVYTSPSIKAQRQAVGHRIHSYYRIDSTGDQRCQDIIAALHSGHPVVFGTMVGESFTSVSDRTPVDVPAPTERILGGHAMAIVGYLGGNFLIKNSWGTGWGSHGLCLMTPAYITSATTWDLWTPTLGIDFGAWTTR